MKRNRTRPCTPGTRAIARASALLVLLGLFCPTICLADEASATASDPSHASVASVDASAGCHDSAPQQPAHDGAGPGDDAAGEHSDCAHCASTAASTSTDGALDSLDVGVLRPWHAPAWRPRALLQQIGARSHDPPPRDLLLVKSSLLL